MNVTQRGPHRWGPFGSEPTGLVPPLGGNYPGPYPIPGHMGVPRPVDGQKIGDTITLAGFAPGTPVEALPRKEILNVSLQQLVALAGVPDKQFETGSWELAIQATVTGKWQGAVPQVECVCPLLAKIKMGVGTAQVELEVSPFPSAVIPLPCDHVTVTMTWDSFRLQDYGVNPGDLVAPAEVSVSATVQRSTGSSDARRVFVAKADPIGVSLISTVPSMAKRVMVYSNISADVYAAGAIFRYRAADLASEITTGTAAVITTYTGAELGAIRNQGNLADVPGAARWWIYTNFGQGSPVFVDYEIGL